MRAISIFLLIGMVCFPAYSQATVRLKELARIEGVRSNPLIGYGVVVGLQGSGDTSRSKATVQSIANTLQQFGVAVDKDAINSRNVAAVMITAELPPFISPGDKIDINVSSLGDARSLVGGTLLLTPLKAANDRVYALAQGQVSVGGFQFDMNGNLVQKNHTTVGRIPDGAVVEAEVSTDIGGLKEFNLILNQPDFTTAGRVVNALSAIDGIRMASAVHPGKIKIGLDEGSSWVSVIAAIENTQINPDRNAVVVVNERTGTVIAGGNVNINDVSISHGELKVTISTDYRISQPSFIGRASSGVRSIVVPDTDIKVQEDQASAVGLTSGATVAELVLALKEIKVTTRDLITILQGIKSAGALNAQLVIQ